MDVTGLLEQLTLEEKASICSGRDFWNLQPIDRLGIPAIMVSDGPHGLRKQATPADHIGITESVPATCFPTAATTASSWNPQLLREVGVALAEECLQEGVSVILGPGANIKRSPLCGRNFEYFSEDPYLSGRLAASLIEGTQSRGVGTSLKHYVANNQEYHRMVVDAVIDERTLREIYLAGFEYAVKSAAPWTVMCSYNRVNGSYLCEHNRLIRDVLKDEWGHEGIVVTDWGAMNDRVRALEAGVELEMPGNGGVNDELITEAVRSGTLGEEILDAAVERILALVRRADANREPDFRYDVQTHHALARRAAEESAVLIKNDDGALPLEPSGTIAVIGAFAAHMRYQGSGSSRIVPTHVDQPLEAIVELVGERGTVTYAPAFSLEDGEVEHTLMHEALRAAAEADTVVVFLGLPSIIESEGFDRDHMRLPENQVTLVTELIKAGVRPVVVLQNGSPIELPFLDQVPAILETYLPGQAGGSATARLLFGEANPSGKLAESFPRRLEDNPCHPWFPGSPRRVEYREGIWVGYRYYEAAGVEPAVPFGHGLSYTTFEYADLRIETPEGRDDAIEPDELGEHSGIDVTCCVRNTGARAGWDIVQLYVADEESTVHRPRKELKGFAKVWLEPGESSRVRIALGRRAFAFWDSATHDWMIEAGRFRVLVGASSADIRLQAELSLRGTGTPAEPPSALSAYYEPHAGTANLDDDAFEALLGRPLPRAERARPFHRNSTLGDISTTIVGRLVARRVRKEMEKTVRTGSPREQEKLISHLVREMPLRSFVLMGGGMVSPVQLDGLLEILNGRPIRGLRTLRDPHANRSPHERRRG
jgi:beta-glucosidase